MMSMDAGRLARSLIIIGGWDPHATVVREYTAGRNTAYEYCVRVLSSVRYESAKSAIDGSSSPWANVAGRSEAMAQGGGRIFLIVRNYPKFYFTIMETETTNY